MKNTYNVYISADMPNGVEWFEVVEAETKQEAENIAINRIIAAIEQPEAELTAFAVKE